MQVFVVVGSKKDADSYVEAFCEAKKIPQYLRIFFEEFKILDARNLAKHLSKKLPEDQKQVIYIKNPTVEAQNAVLKQIEEISESSFVFFTSSGKEDLLPTVLSRSHIVMLSKPEETESDKGMEQDLLKALSQNQLRFSFADMYLSEKESIEKLIRTARTLLIKNPTDERLYFFLKELTEISKLVLQNNVQGKFSAEVLLGNLGRNIAS